MLEDLIYLNYKQNIIINIFSNLIIKYFLLFQVTTNDIKIKFTIYTVLAILYLIITFKLFKKKNLIAKKKNEKLTKM